MFQFDENKLLQSFVAAFPVPVLTPAQTAALDKLLGFLSVDPDITDLRWAAYMLATVKHECADTWQPISERGPTSYFDRYNAGTPIGIRLGNTQPGDGHFFRGRGYVQITGRTNYQNMGDVLQIRLVDNPDMALDSQTAYKIMSHGMYHGSFTGKKLNDYITANKCDYLNARRIINALDQAQRIQGYAQKIETLLQTNLLP